MLYSFVSMQPTYENAPTHAFRQRYWLSLGITALLFFLGYYLLTVSLSEQNSYISLMRLINQQTLINQEIDKQILLLQNCDKDKSCEKRVKNAEEALQTFKDNHQKLQKRHSQLYKRGKNENLDSLYTLYVAYYEPIISSTLAFIQLKKDLLQTALVGKPTQQISRKIDLTLKKILYQEAHLTSILKDMTLAYHSDTLRYGRNIQLYQTLVLLFGLLVLVAEALWLFAPVASKLEKHVQEMQETHQEVEANNTQLKLAFAQLQEAEEITKNAEC